MKEFVDKLISRLDEEIGKFDEKINKGTNYTFAVGCNDAYKHTIEIVKDLAEEHNGGWIPCSERLPDYTGGYICTVKECQESLELIYSTFDGLWRDEYNNKYNVLAWMPLPAPYQPKGE